MDDVKLSRRTCLDCLQLTLAANSGAVCRKSVGLGRIPS